MCLKIYCKNLVDECPENNNWFLDKVSNLVFGTALNNVDRHFKVVFEKCNITIQK